MKWAHLPDDGGLYNQHPDLLDAFMVIMAEENKVERKRAEEQQRQAQKGNRGRATGRKGRR